LVAIIRRLDLDADARLSHDEFVQGVSPLEAYTKNSTKTFKKSLTLLKQKRRPTTASRKPF
jgi:hypothetical protein